jgi:prolyl-tRNA synthetase
VVAPADVQVVATGKGDEALAEAERITAELESAGVRVLLDDRKASPGVKFADAELLGVPTILIVGRGLADGVVELRDRRTGERQDVPVGSAVHAVLEAVRS